SQPEFKTPNGNGHKGGGFAEDHPIQAAIRKSSGKNTGLGQPQQIAQALGRHFRPTLQNAGPSPSTAQTGPLPTASGEVQRQALCCFPSVVSLDPPRGGLLAHQTAGSSSPSARVSPGTASSAC